MEGLVERLGSTLAGCQIEAYRNLLYDLTIDDDGKIRMGCDRDSGEPIRGRGKGFQQDILVFEYLDDGDSLPVVPRVILEAKYKNVTTHDVIVYKEKARRLRTVYPYVRYGMLLGSMPTVPARALRLGQALDFFVAMADPLNDDQLESLRAMLSDEVQASRDLAQLMLGTMKVKGFRRRVTLDVRPAQ